ncbi:hypothetical protein B7P34_04830 [Streptosporangium nondiastaticum]|uniref:Uncharacterized protein n=1 Tax=Streptosporangium nondiastaticum TaxID=35764 RepID=A0A9X7JTW2_9ACTN|nr:hypothetical protein [Streptosporangium nondiastaticum]PSJ29838.1 hypothetical protein B7P34_04830 [Streptosporangium nondiastaticum]
MTTPPPDPTPVALELERLRAVAEVGFARMDGSLALLVQRGDQTDKALAEHRAEIDELKRGRWPLPSVAAVVALAALLLSLWQTITH